MLRTGLALLLVTTSAQLAGADPFADRIFEERRERFERDARLPSAVVPLFGLLDLWEEVGDRKKVETFLERATNDGRIHPLVRARAQYLESLMLRRKSYKEKAEVLRKHLGIVEQFWVLGPFDNESDAGHDAVLPPEKQPFSESASFTGKERSVTWRKLPDVVRQGIVSLDTVLRPDENATAYLTFAVRTDKARRIAVRLGSSGPIKVWVNDRLIGAKVADRPLRWDQDAFGANLAAGWNQVTVKTSTHTGPWGVLVRITEPDGSPLELETSTDPRNLRAAKSPAFHGAVADLRVLLEKASKKPTPETLVDWATYLAEVSPDDKSAERANDLLYDAVALAPSFKTYLRLGETETDANQKRAALESALNSATRAPDRARALALLGELDHQLRRDKSAEDRWYAAIKLERNEVRARMRLAELAEERGLYAKAAQELDALSKIDLSLRLERLRAQLAWRRHLRSNAEGRFQKLWEENQDDLEAMQQLYLYARDRGRTSAALTWLDRIETVRPAASQAFDRAELLEALDKNDEALRAILQAVDVTPDDARIRERAGRLLQRSGKVQEGLDQLKQSLALRPQNPELRAYVNELVVAENKAGDLARAHAENVPALIKKTRSARPQEGAAWVLTDTSVTRVLRNGLTETFQQRVVEVLNEQGVRQEGDFEIRYTPDTQTVEVRAARIYRPDGEVLSAPATEERDVSEPWYGLYYDVKAQVVRFSGIRPGDVLDVEYVVSDMGRRNQLGDYFGEMRFLEEELPRFSSRYILYAPKDKKLYWNEAGLAGVRRNVSVVGEENIYSFELDNTPKTVVEAGMPGFAELARYVHVSTFKSWPDVAAWYRGLVRTQLEISPAIVRAVRETIAGIKDERDRIRALYDLVVTKTRYVGLEFGIHGYQPYRVSQIFSRKFGDCKDKASLLHVMLKEAGIPSTLILARTRRQGHLAPEPASLSVFDHAILYVPKYNLYLDGTAEFSGVDELPAQDQDIEVLHVNTGELKRTPVLAGDQNRTASTWQVTLDEHGAASIVESMTISGQAASQWRSHYQSPGEQRERYSKIWNGRFPGTQLKDFTIDLSLDRPVSMKSQVQVGEYGRAEGESRLRLDPLGRDAEMLRSYARLSARKTDLIIGYPWQHEETVVVTLPPGWQLNERPSDRVVDSPFGSFRFNFSTSGRTLTAKATLTMNGYRVAQKDYAAFRMFCLNVDAVVSQPLTVQRTAEVKR